MGLPNWAPAVNRLLFRSLPGLWRVGPRCRASCAKAAANPSATETVKLHSRPAGAVLQSLANDCVVVADRSLMANQLWFAMRACATRVDGSSLPLPLALPRALPHAT